MGSGHTIRRLQMTLNVAARLVVGLDKYEHIILVLRDVLHGYQYLRGYSSKLRH